MAVPALKFEVEEPMEERVARLEVNVEYVQAGVSELKVDVRRLHEKIDGVDQKHTARFDQLNDTLSSFRLEMEKRFSGLEVRMALDRVWHLLSSAGILAIMAKAFKWI